jgi:hypothetical protein
MENVVCAARLAAIALRVDLAPTRQPCAAFAASAELCHGYRVGRMTCHYNQTIHSCRRASHDVCDLQNASKRMWWYEPRSAALAHSLHSRIRTRAAYVTLAVANLESPMHIGIVVNRTRCFRLRLRELGTQYPLLVVTNLNETYDAPLVGPDSPRKAQSTPSNRAVRIERKQTLRAASYHLNKYHVWRLVEHDRLIFLDSDLYLRSLPDMLMHMPLPSGSALAAVPSPCSTAGHVFNSGFMVLTPNLTVADDLLTGRHARGVPHACTGSLKGDQYYLNGYFMYRWTPLSTVWNEQRHYLGRPVRVHPNENTHFVGTHKPPWHHCVHATVV